MISSIKDKFKQTVGYKQMKINKTQRQSLSLLVLTSTCCTWINKWTETERVHIVAVVWHSTKVKSRKYVIFIQSNICDQ